MYDPIFPARTAVNSLGVPLLDSFMCIFSYMYCVYIFCLDYLDFSLKNISQTPSQINKHSLIIIDRGPTGLQR